MKIELKASKSELVAAAEIKKFLDRVTIGWVKRETEREAERVAKVDSLKASMEIPEQYMDDVVKILNTYSIELVAIIRGAISLANGLKGLISSNIKADFKATMQANKPVMEADYVSEGVRCKTASHTTVIYDDKYAA